MEVYQTLQGRNKFGDGVFSNEGLEGKDCGTSQTLQQILFSEVGGGGQEGVGWGTEIKELGKEIYDKHVKL